MAIPTEHAWREYAVFLRGPTGLNTFAFGTRDAYRSSVQHKGLISVFPEPGDNPADDFGITTGGGFTVEIADEGDEDWYLLLPDGSPLLLADDSGFIILGY